MKNSTSFRHLCRFICAALFLVALAPLRVAAQQAEGVPITVSATNVPLAATSETPATPATPAAATNAADRRAVRVSGQVTAQDGTPLPGVSVLVKDQVRGTITDTEGRYVIDASPSQQLTFSMIGYNNQDIYVGPRSMIDVVMQEALTEIDGVIVTALGLKRDEKSLGYAATKVGGDQFSSVTTSRNWLEGLNGQVAGLTIQKANSGPGGTTRLSLRGESSFDLSNNGALMVVDGVPMFNNSTAAGESSAYSIDYGDGSGDVSADNIESITVLKGPAATALYGSEAANGAIIITTKSAENMEGNISVTYTASATMDRISGSPDLQYEYGQGGSDGYNNFHYGGVVDGGEASTADLTSWGPKMDGTQYYQFFDARRGIGVDENGERIKTPFVSYGNWFDQFFQTGWTLSNSVAVSAKINRNNSIRFYASDYRNETITPNSGNSKQSFLLKSTNVVNSWFRVETAVHYSHQGADNLPTLGYGAGSVMYSLWGMAANMDMDWAKTYWREGQENVQQENTLTGKNNPYFVVNELINTQDRHRAYGNTAFKFTLTKGMELMLRGGFDMSNELRTERQPWSSYSKRRGYYMERLIQGVQLYGDFLLKYDRELGAGFHFTGNVGGSIKNRSFTQAGQTAEQLKRPGVYSLDNSLSFVKTDHYRYTRQTNSLYGLVQFSWRSAIFLDITGRGDWSSTLPKGNNAYFYPSVSASVLVNELFDMGAARKHINMIKLRASWAQVGNDTKPYRSDNYLASAPFPGTYALPGTMANIDLMPEQVTSVEVGLEMIFLQNRIRVDVAAYESLSEKQIIRKPISSATGVPNMYTNSGSLRNRGIEITASFTPVRTRDWEWTVGGNWSMNRNKVLDLGGSDSWIIASYSSHAYMIAYEGGSISSMYGLGYKRAPEGSYTIGSDGKMTDVSGKLLLDSNGLPQYTDEMQYIGDTAPKWRGGFSTSVRWKGLKLYVAFDGQFGGNVYSYTNATLGNRGKGTATLPGRYGGLIVDGVQQTADGNYIQNGTVTPDISEYYGIVYNFQNCEQNFVSTQFLKLREARLEYVFDKELLAKSKFIKGLTIAVYGRDLFCWSDFPGWDPEGLLLRGAAVIPGFEITQMPSTRSFGGSVSITF